MEGEAAQDGFHLFSKLMDTIPYGLVILDASCNYILVNQAYADLYSKDPDFFAFKNVFVLHPDDESRAIFRSVLETGRPFQANARPYRRNDRDGVTYWDWNIYPLKGDGPEIKGLLWCLVDVTPRVASQKALAESERRLKEAQRIGRIGDWEHDLSTGRTYWSENVYRLLNRDPDMGAPTPEESRVCYDTKDMEQIEAGIQRAVHQGVRIEQDLKVQCLDGSADHHVIVTPVYDAGGRIEKLVGTIQDITDRKRIETMCRQKAQQLEERVKELKCLYQVSQLMDRLDCSMDTIFQGVLDVILNTYHHQDLIQARITVGDKVYQTDGFYKTKGGIEEPIKVYNESIGFLEICYLDGGRLEEEVSFLPESRHLFEELAVRLGRVLERRQTERERLRLAAAIEQSTESVMVVDAKVSSILYVNPAFERQTGYSRSEVISANPMKILNNKRNRLKYREIKEAVKDGQGWSGRLATQKTHGRIFEGEVTLSPIRDQNGRVINYVLMGRDITREAWLENQLRQAQKMEAIGTLAGGIAHDFNNLLWAITGFAEMTLTEADEDSETFDNMSQLLKAAGRAKDLIEQILLFSRHGGQEKETLPLVPLVKEVLKLIRASVPTTIEICQKLPEDDVFILANSTQIHQVLLNLCSNAAHAMRNSQGVLTVGLNTIIEAPKNLIGYPNLVPGPLVELTVEDTGVGMAPSILERIFDPFFTTKNPVEGTGMGLAAVHGIVQDHGGGITVDSRPHQGSVFKIYFPKAPGAIQEEMAALAQSPRGTEHILFIDDEELLVEMARRMLQLFGYKVTCATDSMVAIDLFRTNPDKFDLIITDQTMPHMTGTELALKALEIKPGIPIILCSGYKGVISDEDARKYGIRAFTAKPLDMAEITRLIRAVLDN